MGRTPDFPTVEALVAFDSKTGGQDAGEKGAIVFGIIIEVTVDPAREDEARRMLHERIVPKAKSHAGFLSGQWLRAVDGDVLRSVHIFDSEDNAQAAASQIRAEGPRLGPPVGVTLQAVDAYEVIATA